VRCVCVCSNLLKDRNLKIIFKKAVTASQKTHFSLKKTILMLLKEIIISFEKIRFFYNKTN